MTDPKDIISNILTEHLPLKLAEELAETIIAGLEENIDLEVIKREFEEQCKHCSQSSLNADFLKGNGLLIHDKDDFVYLDEKAVWAWIEEKIKAIL